MSRKLTCFWNPIDELVGALEALSDAVLSADFDIDEITELIYVRREITYIAQRLDDMLEGRHSAPLVCGVIDNLDHPILREVLQRRTDARNQAARIIRSGMKEVRR